MKKGYLVGGLAIVGAIALLMYLKPKNKANSEGFYGANGRVTYTGKARITCKLCQDSGSGGTYQNWNGICDEGDKCIKKSA
jgi:hypothetical protein